MDTIIDPEAVAEPTLAVTVEVLIPQTRYEELLASHHCMEFFNDPKAQVTIREGHRDGRYYICEYTDPLTLQHQGIEFGDTPREALEKALSVVKKRRAYREGYHQENAA